MKAEWLQWIPRVAMASFLAAGVLRWVLPEPLRNLQMAERVVSFGLFSLLLWLWLTRGWGRIGNAHPVWIGWLGLVGLTVLLAPGMLWVILAEDPINQAPPAWVNGLTLSGYPLVLVWACFRLKWSYGMMRKARRELAELLHEKE
ncbi:MAG: hypothetical protein HY648_11695 [Acidobacteria bacterium]|nr:hypothetical protein [Acidobacteriota bacterium]